MENEYDYYIAHPFNSRKKVREWQLSIEKKFGIKCFNAFYPQREHEIFDNKDVSGKKYYVKIFGKDKLIVEDDLKYMKKCENVIVIIDGALSYGTIQEMVYAKLYEKNVYAIITNKQELHPWLLYHSDSVFTKKEDFEEWLKSTLQKTAEKDKNINQE